MWRAHIAHLEERGISSHAVDLPGHGTRLSEDFSLGEAFATIDRAVHDAADRGPVILVGHSMGGLLSTVYVGGDAQPPVATFVAASCTALPRGAGLAAYRVLAGGFNALPGHGAWMTEQFLAATLPADTRDDFGAGGYAFAAQDAALRSLGALNLPAALARITIPTWFVNGQFDQLRLNERLFTSLVPHAELIIVPQATHLVTAAQPRVFNALLDLAIAVTRQNALEPSLS